VTNDSFTLKYTQKIIL